MIFGEIVTDQHYYGFYPELLDFCQRHFREIESGVQGDAYIWIFEENEKVMLDTFTSMRFQIKAVQEGGKLLEKIILLLQSNYNVFIYKEPEIEGHEELPKPP